MYINLYIGVAFALFTSLFVLTKQKPSLNDKILVVWVLFLAFPLLTRILSPVGLDIPVPVLKNRLVYSLCYGPFLWLFIESLVGELNRITPRTLVHFLPFIFVSIYQVGFEAQTVIPLPNAPVDTRTMVEKGFQLSNALFLIIYSIACLWRLNKHQKELLDNFSSLPDGITLNWLKWVALAFMVFILLPLIPIEGLMKLHGISLTGFIFVLSFFGLKQSQVFIYLEEEKQPESHTEPESRLEHVPPQEEDFHLPVAIGPVESISQADKDKGKYENSGLTDDDAKVYSKRLEEYTEKEKPYLVPNLTVEKLAEQLEIPRHHLSEVLSGQMNKTFYQFVNEHRVNHVKHLLSEPENSEKSLLDIAYESGFNSKSTFNSVFKKMTNMTPTQYRTSAAE